MSEAAAASRNELGPRAARRRAEILAVAERVFAERGFAAARLEDVAEQVGIRRASLVYYFRDKAELYDAVLADAFGGLLARIEPALTGDGTLAERAEAAVSAWVDFLAERPTVARLLLREVADGAGDGEPALVRHTKPFHQTVSRVLAESGEDPLAHGAPVDPVHLASTVAGSTVFFLAAMPTLLPGRRFDPFARERLEAHRAELLGITRRLLEGGHAWSGGGVPPIPPPCDSEGP